MYSKTGISTKISKNNVEFDFFLTKIFPKTSFFWKNESIFKFQSLKFVEFEKQPIIEVFLKTQKLGK
jgi:hypothetical protein